MIKSLIIPLVILLLVVEFLIYRRYIKTKSRKIKIIYTSFTAAIYLFLIGSSIAAINFVNPNGMAVMTWAVLLMLINLKVKSIFTIATIIDFFAKRRLKWTKIMARTLSVFAVGVIMWGVIIGRNSIRVENITISSPEIPVSFDNYRIAQFSDVHLGNLMLTNVLENMVEEINNLNVDLVVQSGDLVNLHYLELTDENIDILSEIESMNGVIAVLGNHDLGFYLADTLQMTPRETVDGIKRIQRNVLGWTLLENENIKIRRGADSLVIAGVTYPKNMNHNNYNSLYGGSDLSGAMRGVNDSSFSVLVSHTPKLFDSIPKVARPDLTLSGHVHSMQMKVNIGDWKWSPARWLYMLYSGLYTNGKEQLYVNDGLGYVLFPFRIGARPEITVITLKHTN